MIEIKGSVLIDSIKSVKKHYGEDSFRKIMEELDIVTRKIFEDPYILYPKWYPLDAFIKFLEADIRITASGNENELIKRSERIIEKQLRGIYKVFVKLGKPEFVIQRISTTHQSYFNGVSIKAEIIDSKKAHIKYIGFEKHHRLIGFSIIGFYKKALEISGAKNIDVTYITPIEQGKGFCTLEIKWTKK